MTITAICNQKGGVAKTTTCLSLGACLAELGRRVLLVDLDPQGSLTLAAGLAQLAEESYGAADLLAAAAEGSPIALGDAVLPTGYPGLDLLAGDAGLSVAERDLAAHPRAKELLRAILEPAAYDDVLIDCSPSLGLLTLMALTAARAVIVPVQCDFLAVHGVIRLEETISAVRAYTNPDLAFHLLITQYDRRSAITRAVQARLEERYADRLFETVIGVDTRLRESTVSGEPIIAYAPRTRASQQYRALAQEVLQREERTTPV